HPPAQELLRLRARPRAVDELGEEGAQRALELVERAEGEIVELATVLLVEGARGAHAKALASIRMGARGLLRLVDQLGDVAGLEVEERTVDSDPDHLAGRRRQSAPRGRRHARPRAGARA